MCSSDLEDGVAQGPGDNDDVVGHDDEADDDVPPAQPLEPSEYAPEDDRSISDIRASMRVAHEGRFELYFMLDLDDIKVSRSIINACIFELDRKALCTAIEEINNKGDIIYFLEEIRSLSDKIPYGRLSLIASVLLDLHGGFKGENSKSIFSRAACDVANYFIEDIIKKLNTEKEKYQIIRAAIEKVDKNGLAARKSGRTAF